MRWQPSVSRSVGPGGELQVSVGQPLIDEYLRFLTARARPNTRLAVAFDLKVFFFVVDKTPARVTSADVMAFIRHQRAAGQTVVRIDGSAGLSPPHHPPTSVVGLGLLRLPAGTWRHAGGPQPRAPGAWPPAARASGAGAAHWSGRPPRFRGCSRPARSTPSSPPSQRPRPGHGRRHGAGRPAPLRGAGPAPGRHPPGRAAGVHRRRARVSASG